jgi:hypothetical protein
MSAKIIHDAEHYILAPIIHGASGVELGLSA